MWPFFCLGIDPVNKTMIAIPAFSKCHCFLPLDLFSVWRNGKTTDTAGRCVDQHWVCCFFFLMWVRSHSKVAANSLPAPGGALFLHHHISREILSQRFKVWYQAGSTDDPKGNEKLFKNLHTSRLLIWLPDLGARTSSYTC